MRHPPARRLGGHVPVELLVDNFQLMTGKGAGIFIGSPERCIIEQKFPPDVRTDEREVIPWDAKAEGKLSLALADCTLA